MNGRSLLRALAAVALLTTGCVEIEQEIHMNHDGSGKIVEKVALTPRGMRLFEGMKKRTGSNAVTPALLGDEALQTRLKAMGEVTLESKELLTLSDGRKQLKAVYAFKDSNKVKLWMAPTFSYMKPDRGARPDGGIRLAYNPSHVSWGKLYRETVTVEGWNSRMLPQLRERSSPAETQKFLRVLPIFQDALKELHLSIVLVAPIEEFEEADMKRNLPIDRNRVTILRIDGDTVARSPETIRQLMMNEVVAGSLAGLQASMPGVFTPWPEIHGGRLVRFMKSTPAPAEAK